MSDGDEGPDIAGLKMRLDMADDDNIMLHRTAARLANALTDINNLLGGMQQVKEVMESVEQDVDEYRGLENYSRAEGEADD